MSATTSLPPIPLYLAYTKDEGASAAAAARGDPQAVALIAHFRAVAPKITSPAALLSDQRVLSLVLGAFGLGARISQTALLRKLLSQDPHAPGSLAASLADPKIIGFAEAFRTWKPPPLTSPKNVTTLINAYRATRFEQAADTQAAGLQDALYFKRNIGGITSLTQLQSDPNLLKVAARALGVPYDTYAALDFTRQTALLKAKIKLSDLTNAHWVAHTAELYLLQKNVTQIGTPVAQPGTLAALFGGSDATASSNSLLTILDTSLSSSTGTTIASGSVLSLFA